MTDAELLSDFLIHRDHSAFEILVRRHGPMVLGVCRDVLADSHDVDDAFQATFMVLIRKASAIRDRSSLGPWLYEVAWKTSRRTRYQSARHRATQKQVTTMDTVSSPDGDNTGWELKPLLHEEIHLLPGRLRDAIVLCYLEGFAVEAAAKRLECPVGTLKSRLSKGREILRSRLTRRGLGVTAILLLLAYLTDEASAAVAVPEQLVESTIYSGLDALRTRSAFAQFLDRSRFNRPWTRRVTSAVVVATLLIGTVPVLKWSGLSVIPRVAAATIPEVPIDGELEREPAGCHTGDESGLSPVTR